jgi:phosphoenolpyruvate synthase/pyruvate phosphate dikinase
MAVHRSSIQGMGADPVFNFWSFPMSALFSPTALVVPFENLRMTDVEAVGGKNASLGEMISQLPQGVRVPTGFATTAHAFREFLAYDGLADKHQRQAGRLDTEDVRALAQVGAEIRAMVEAQPFPADLEQAIREEFADCRPATRTPALPCARRPRRRTCPTLRSLASRKPF